MFRFIRALSVLCLLMVAIVLLAGCGSSDDGQASTTGLVAPPTRTPAPDVTPTPEPRAVEEPAPPPITVTEMQLGLGMADQLRWSADGAQLMVDGSLGTWAYTDLAAGAQPEAVVVPWTGFPVVSPDGRYAAANDADEVQHLWDVESGAALFPLDSDDGNAWYFRFSADGTQIAATISPPVDAASPTSFYPGELPGASLIRVWAIASGETTDYEPPEDRLLDIGFDAAGHLIVAGSDNNIPRYQWSEAYTQPLEIPAESSDPAVRVWDMTADEQIAALDDLENPVTDANLSGNAARMAGIVTVQTSQYGFTDWELHAWDIATGTQIFDEQLNPISPIVVRTFSPDGSTLTAAIGVRVQDESGTYYTSNTDDQVWRWNLDTGDDLPPLTSALLLTEWSEALRQIAYSPDGSQLAGLTRDGLIVVWNLAAPDTPQAEFAHFMRSVESVTVSTDGQTVYSGSQDGTLRAWALASGTSQAQFMGHTIYAIMGLETLPGDLLLVKEGDRSEFARLWDLATGTSIARINHRRGLPYSAPAPGGTLLASSGGGGTVNLWNLNSGSIDSVILAAQQVVSLAFMPDDAQLVTGGMDGSIMIWDVASGAEVAVLRGHTGGVTHLVFTPEGALISASLNPITVIEDRTGNREIAAEPDFTVRRWDIDAGTSDVLLEVAPLEPPSPDTIDSTAAWTVSPLQYGPFVSDSRAIALSAGGTWLALIDYSAAEPMLRVWHILDGTVALEQPLSELPLSSLAFGPEDTANGEILLVGGRRDGLITVWRLARAVPDA